jgi:hypothetical protein
MRVAGSVLGSVVLGAGLLLLSPSTAFAEDPADLHGAYVLDESGVLGGRQGEVQDALDALFDDTGAKVFVVYVDAFENPSDAQSWADRSAQQSGLGDADLLLAIATVDRNYAVSTGSAFPVDDAGIDGIITDRLLPALRDDDWAGGAITFADGVRAAQVPSPVPLIVGGVAAAGTGTAIVIGVVRSRRRKRRARQQADEAAAALDQKAGTLLVQLDDALKTSEQELGFAQAQFGEDQTRDFMAALADARQLAKQAFELRQKLDDAFPETAEQHRSMTEQLISLAEQADGVLDEQAEAFDQLRELEKNAPQVLEQVAADQKGLEPRIATAESAIAELAATYPKADLTSLHDMPGQARKLAAFAATTVAKARTALGKRTKNGDPDAGAALAVRAAQQAVGQVEQLIAGVDRVKADLEAQAARDAQTAAELEAKTRDARSAVENAQDYITTHRGAIGTTARTRISEATRHLDESAGLAATDPAKALAEVQQAATMAAAALALARDDVDEQQSYRPQSYPGGQDDGFDGAVLGGILGQLFGGGSSSSSSSGSWWGGGSSGSSWGGSGWGGGSSHHSSGGSLFGGGGHSSSGGGHSRRSSRTSGRRGHSGRF